MLCYFYHFHRLSRPCSAISSAPFQKRKKVESREPSKKQKITNRLKAMRDVWVCVENSINVNLYRRSLRKSVRRKTRFLDGRLTYGPEGLIDWMPQREKSFCKLSLNCNRICRAPACLGWLGLSSMQMMCVCGSPLFRLRPLLPFTFFFSFWVASTARHANEQWNAHDP